MTSIFEFPLSYLPSFDESMPARVYVHVAAIHDHHAEELHHMVRGTDGTWSARLELPDDVCSSYLIAPVDEGFIRRFDPPGPVDTRARWHALVERAIPGPPALSGCTGRVRGPHALPEPEWEDLTPTPGYWESLNVSGRQTWRTLTGDSPRFLLLLFDGSSWIRTPLPRALREGGFPPLEVIAIQTGTGNERFDILGCTPALPRWLHEELLPRTSWTPEETIVCGQSLGGLAALAVAIGEPHIANHVLSQSGSFWFPAWGGRDGGQLATTLQDPQVINRIQTRRIRAHMSVGWGEADMIPHTRAVADCLMAADVRTSLEMSNHGHEMAGWMGALTRGLGHLLR